MNNETNYNISQQVMEQINAEHITIRPKFYFILGSIGLIIGLTSLILIAVMLTDVATFHIRNHEPFGYLSFGKFGLETFLETFPFVPIIGALASIGGGLYLIRVHSLSYKISTYVIAGVLIISIGTVAFIVDSTGVNEQVVGNTFMRGFMVPAFSDDHYIIGEIVEVVEEDKQFLLITPENNVLLVQISQETEMSDDLIIKPGIRIKAVGEWEDTVFIAEEMIVGGMRWKPLPTGPYPSVKGMRYPMHRGQMLPAL